SWATASAQARAAPTRRRWRGQCWTAPVRRRRRSEIETLATPPLGTDMQNLSRQLRQRFKVPNCKNSRRCRVHAQVIAKNSMRMMIIRLVEIFEAVRRTKKSGRRKHRPLRFQPAEVEERLRLVKRTADVA